MWSPLQMKRVSWSSSKAWVDVRIPSWIGATLFKERLCDKVKKKKKKSQRCTSNCKRTCKERKVRLSGGLWLRNILITKLKILLACDASGRWKLKIKLFRGGKKKEKITQSAAALLDMGQFWINLATIVPRLVYLFIHFFTTTAWGGGNWKWHSPKRIHPLSAFHLIAVTAEAHGKCGV